MGAQRITLKNNVACSHNINILNAINTIQQERCLTFRFRKQPIRVLYANQPMHDVLETQSY